MGFFHEDDSCRLLKIAPAVERAMVNLGIILLRYWLEVIEENQIQRLESWINDGRKISKLSRMDLKSYSRWYDYSPSARPGVRRK